MQIVIVIGTGRIWCVPRHPHVADPRETHVELREIDVLDAEIDVDLTSI